MSEVGARNEATRIAWVEQALARVPPGARLLDAGAGEQRFRSSCGHLRYVAQDFAKYDGKGDGVGLQTGGWDQSKLDLVSDISSIPAPDTSFDAILCTEVFEHLAEPLLALKEFARLLRPGGELILTAPFCSLTHFAPFHFSTGFGRYYYKRHLPAHGFEIVELTPNGNFFEYLAQEVRRAGEIGRRYAGALPSRWDAIGMKLVLRMLERFSGRDGGSSELLCFGWHVRAVRRPPGPVPAPE